jgi:hypothetical protein
MGQSVEISTTRPPPSPLRADEDRSSLSMLCHSPDYFPSQCRRVFLFLPSADAAVNALVVLYGSASPRIQGDEGECNQCDQWKPFETGLIILRWKSSLKKLVVAIRIHNYVFKILAHKRYYEYMSAFYLWLNICLGNVLTVCGAQVA